MDIKIQSRINNYRKSQINSAPIYSGFDDKKTVKQNQDNLTINKTSHDNGSKAISNSFLDVINFDIESVGQYLDEDKFSIDGTYLTGYHN